jgi:ApaG protein
MLKTSTGVMHGTYQMVATDGEQFDAEIAPFALHGPYTVH